jgi:hypothetical protein
VKTGSPDPADFAMTRHLNRQLWHFAQWLGRPLAYRRRHSAKCQWALPDMPQLSDFGRFFFCDGHDMLTVTQTIARSAKNHQWIRYRVVAKSAESRGPDFRHMDGLLYGPVLCDF